MGQRLNESGALLTTGCGITMWIRTEDQLPYELETVMGYWDNFHAETVKRVVLDGREFWFPEPDDGDFRLGYSRPTFWMEFSPPATI